MRSHSTTTWQRTADELARALSARSLSRGMFPKMDARITDLEVRYVYLERTVGELDQVVCELRAEIEKLKRQVKELTHTVRDGDGGDSPTPDEKPPHY